MADRKTFQVTIRGEEPVELQFENPEHEQHFPKLLEMKVCPGSLGSQRRAAMRMLLSARIAPVRAHHALLGSACFPSDVSCRLTPEYGMLLMHTFPSLP
jgi:hypothetical protein